MTTVVDKARHGFRLPKAALVWGAALMSAVGSLGCGGDKDDPTPVTPATDEKYVAIISPENMQLNMAGFLKDNTVQFRFSKADFRASTPTGSPIIATYAPGGIGRVNATFLVNKSAVTVHEGQKGGPHQGMGYLTGAFDNSIMAEFKPVGGADQLYKVGNKIITEIWVEGDENSVMPTDVAYAYSLRETLNSAIDNQSANAPDNALTAIGVEGGQLVKVGSPALNNYKRFKP